MSTGPEHTSRVAQEVMESLQSDLVSAGELRQIIANALPDKTIGSAFIAEVIRHLLEEGVEIGDARNTDGTYVKFIAWRGTVSDRCERAIRQVESVSGGDREFAFWLCLRDNVDEYEMAWP